MGIAVTTLATMLVVGGSPAAASTSSIDIVGTSEFGTVQGTEFTRYDCRYSGIADEQSYVRLDGTTGDVQFDVACSIVLPADPSQWNGQIVLEPLDQVVPFVPEGEFSRAVLLTDEVVFGFQPSGRRNGYASVSYAATGPTDVLDQQFGIDSDGDGLPDAPAAIVEILADFPSALRSGGGSGILGPGSSYGAVDDIQAIGFSNQGTAMRGAMAFAEANGLHAFDAALPMATALTLLPDAAGLTAPAAEGAFDFGDQRALFVNSETEVIPNGTFDVFGVAPTFSSIDLRSEADGTNRFLYEVAGGSHLDPANQSDLIAVGAVPPGAFDDSSPLKWSAVLRAVFAKMNRWVTLGLKPPSSRLLDPAPDATAADPAYGTSHPSVLAATVNRDQNLNATGGIRLPNVELGVGTYLAVGPPLVFIDPVTEFFQWLAGGFVDLSCEPLADGSERFKSNRQYVRKVIVEAAQLVADGFLLLRDAFNIVAEARASGIGDCP